ncbi:MAG: nucleotidyltransferase domain-containing protein [Dehalococcoidia bacterium]|nr:nucleotidyltransferase domain-containing protein [Dehalococcoidia bacterium]MCB9485357.1 nucleotidyltransferase domain-containing protein [Thermoflexaceae bacterium]
METKQAAVDSEIVRAARDALLSEERVAVAYLFGSFARGSAGSKSDLDIAVLLNVPIEKRLGGPLDELRDAVERSCRRPCDLIDARSAPADLVHRILRDGVLLVERDRSARIAFEVAKRNEYFDLLPYLREYRRARKATRDWRDGPD